MRRPMFAVTIVRALLAGIAVAVLNPVASAQPGVSYPKVYGPTGSLYGPTQAHYQYQRQYGRAWTPPAGTTVRPNAARGVNGGYTYVAPSSYVVPPPVPYLPYGYGPFFGGYRGVSVRAPFVSVDVGRSVSVAVPGVLGVGVGVPYAPYGVVGAGPFFHQGWESVAPSVRQAHPLWVGGNPFDNEVLARARLEEQQRWQQPLAIQPVKSRPKPLVSESSPEMIARSVRHRSNGDDWFRKLRYTTAYDRYKNAITAAGEIPDNHLRAGFALVAMGRPALAARYFQRAVEIAPELPGTGIPLEELFGEENRLARSSTILKTSAWVREDIRDPERLFVLGVMLHFDGQREKAAEFFETALRLAGKGDHLHAFLRTPAPVEVAKEVFEVPNADGPLVPVPDPNVPPLQKIPRKQLPLPALPLPE